MPDHERVRFQLQLPDEVLTVPQLKGLTLQQSVSTILPFNLSLDDGVRLTYATAQLLTSLHNGEEVTYAFFTPEGMHAELALDKTTYQAIEVTGGTLQKEQERDYILAEPGMHCRIQITTLKGSLMQLLVLTQEQAWKCWKVQLWGKERLLLTDALVLDKDDELHLYWRGPATIDLAVYPPLPEQPNAAADQLATTVDGFFSRYTVIAPERTIKLAVQQLRPDTLCIELPTTLDGLHDAFLSIDFVGDMGNAYLNGRLVSDHFANGLPWEIGLKRFLTTEAARELIIRFSPLRNNAAALRYFPTGMAFRLTDGDCTIEVKSIQVHPEYHAVLTQR
jgi:beta-galactosidase